MALIQKGTNTKLGAGIGAFSIPALSTCPGKTDYCKSVCYATKGFFKVRNVIGSLASNYDESLKESFVSLMNESISKAKVRSIRIHPSGDFYSEEYIKKWISIVDSNPNINFWVYTRSWRLPEMVLALKELANKNNVQMYASIDSTTPESPPAWLRVANVVKDWESEADSFVKCPNQKNKAITCEKCTYCFKPAKGLKQNVVFKEH